MNYGPFWLILSHFWVLNPRLIGGVERTSARPYGGRRWARRPQGPPLRRLPVGGHTGLPLRWASPSKAATRATPTLVAGGPGQTPRSAPTMGVLPAFGPYAMANQRAQRRDRSGLGLGGGSSRISRRSYLVSHAQGSRASSMRRGSGMSPFSLILSR